MIKIYRFLFRYQNGKWKQKLFFLLLANLALALVTAWEPELLRRAVAALNGREAEAFVPVLWQVGGFVILLIACKAAVPYTQTEAQNFCQISLHEALSDQMLRLRREQTDRYQFGDIATIVINNALQCAEAAIQALVDFSAGICVVFVSCLYMLALEWRITLVLLGYYAVVRIILVFLTREMKKNAREAIRAEKEGTNFLTALLKNMLSVRCASNQDFFLTLFGRKETVIMKKNWKQFVWSNGQQDLVWASSKAAEYLVIYAVGVLVLPDVPLATLFSFLFASDIFNNGVYQFACHLESRTQAEACIGSMKPFLENPAVEEGSFREAWEKRPALRFDHVSFGYGDKKILTDVSFTIPYGEKVLIVGGNGQGKSTLLKLAAGLYRPAGGRIFYGDTDTSSMHLDAMSARYRYISQNSNILDGDVFQNVALAPEYDQARVRLLLKRLWMAGKETVQPDRLSMGEKQRLNIARAFYRPDPDFVLADEILANIDPANKSRVLQLFEEYYRDCTVVMVAHEAMDYAFDRILHVEHGAVREEIIRRAGQ